MRWLVEFFYPRVCIGCRRVLTPDEQRWCTWCHADLMYTDFFIRRSNPVMQMFAAFRYVVFGASLWYYVKKSLIARLIHQFKYMGQRDLAEPLGTELAEAIQRSPFVPAISHVVPVPLHPRRLKERGFNQTELIAQALQEHMNIQVVQPLARVAYDGPQSKRTLAERWSATKGNFALTAQANLIARKHILLLDDVLTTGSTLASCLHVLEQARPASITVVTLAYAGHAL